MASAIQNQKNYSKFARAFLVASQFPNPLNDRFNNLAKATKNILLLRSSFILTQNEESCQIGELFYGAKMSKQLRQQSVNLLNKFEEIPEKKIKIKGK